MKKRTRGFTLVEIMIVVAIIGLLVAIALPNFLKARKKSVIRSAQASLKQIEGAVEQARLDGISISTWSQATISNAIIPDYIKVWPTCPGGGSWDFPSNPVIQVVIDDINDGNAFNAYDTITP